MKSTLFGTVGVIFVAAIVASAQNQGAGAGPGHALNGKRLFETATFGGNGRTCETCHSHKTGTMSPQDAANGSSRIRTIRSSCTTAVTTAPAMASAACSRMRPS